MCKLLKLKVPSLDPKFQCKVTIVILNMLKSNKSLKPKITKTN